MTFSIMTISRIHSHYAERNERESHYAECTYTVIILSVIWMSIIILTVLMLSVIWMSIIILTSIMLSVIMLTVFIFFINMLSVDMLSAIVLSVVAKFKDRLIVKLTNVRLDRKQLGTDKHSSLLCFTTSD
jgi:hypothetical protein